MTRGTGPVVAALTGVLTGCPSDPVPGLGLDLSASCPQARITTVRDEVLTDAYTVHAVAMDAPDESDGWALVTWHEAADSDPHRVVRLSDPQVQVILYGVDSSSQVELRAGSSSGEAWVVERRPEAIRVFRLEAEGTPGLTGQNNNVLDFPLSGTDSWSRKLIFLGGEAHMAAMNPVTDDDVLTVFVGPFGSALGLTSSWTLEFTDPCDPDLSEEEDIACEANKAATSFKDMEFVATGPDPRSPDARLGVARTRLYDNLEDHDELVLITVSRSASGMPIGIMRRLTATLSHPPYTIGVDDFAAYFAHTSKWGDSDDAGETIIWRLDDLETYPTRVFVAAELAPVGARLLQMDGDIGLGRIRDGDFVFTKLFVDAPHFSQVTQVPQRDGDPFVEYSGAGPGHVLLERQDGSPRLIRVECAESSDGPLPNAPESQDP